MGVVSCGTTMIDAGAFVGLPSSGATWDTTAKTGNFTAVSGNGYFVNTTSAAITVTLPSSPSAGDIVALQDYAGTWGTNNVTVARNGVDIGGIAADATLNVSNQSITLLYVDATRGWQTVSDSTQNIDGRSYIVATGGTISTCGDYKVHSFYGPGTFTVCSVGTTPGNNVVDYLVVAGGGMGGHAGTPSRDAGGGGAGGYRESSGVATGNYSASPLGACVSALPVSATGYPVTVGAGGIQTFNNPDQRNGTCGSNSVFSSITSAGGGGGGGGLPANEQAVPGGSGGGGSSSTSWPGYSLPQKRGAGNTPPVSPPQGNNGGEGDELSPTSFGSGGGGGAGAVGETAFASPQFPLSHAGDGGVGVASSINGSTIMRAGGGGGGVCIGNYPLTQTGSGGIGGGGDGGKTGPTGQAGCGAEGKNAVVNTGGGGGGNASGAGSGQFAGNGGSGIVIIRYKYK